MMDEETPRIEVRAMQIEDAQALLQLDSNFETDRIYTLRIQDRLAQGLPSIGEKPALAFELVETQVDPPLYKDYLEYENTQKDLEAALRRVDGGYVALANGEMAGSILLKKEEWRAVTLVEALTVARRFRRYGIGSLLLNCATDWAREHGCWAIVLETQNVNYPAIQFYLRNGLQVWSINQHFYPPGPAAHEVAIFMGKRLISSPDHKRF